MTLSTSDDVFARDLDVKDDVLRFIDSKLDDQQHRDDYREMLILALSLPWWRLTAPFGSPGTHSSCMDGQGHLLLQGMALPSPVRLTVREESAFATSACSPSRLYLKAWFTAPLAAAAPTATWS
ncbi:hypothetical protein GWK47_007647 [Chionoecetes opilio]|uniref:Uncharacterized protein n=1 Tax=Chionoecetes opilio TaxID=41210 RepID=A0A8J5CSS8_CHIOP|nr:hypothetical protein GWK47_007647 [Chionoecetes opilio]